MPTASTRSHPRTSIYAESLQAVVARLRHLAASQQRVNNPQAVDELLPILIITAGAALQWTPAIAAIMNEFAKTIGVNESSSEADIRACVERYYATPPERAQLLVELKAMLRESLLSGAQAADSAAHALQFLLRTPATLQAPQAPPEGAIAAGPMARFVMSQKPLGTKHE